MSIQWGKKISIYDWEDNNKCISSVKMYENTNKIDIKPEDWTFIIIIY
jgi:hypothetical protein